MNWLLPRTLVALAFLALGGLLGHQFGRWFHAPVIGLALGGLAGFTLWLLFDDLRADRLLRWLLATADRDAPRLTGLWAELAHRTQRALRQRENDLHVERQRLAHFLSGIEASPNGVLMLDANDSIVWCNLVSADHLGLDPVRDIGQPITNLVRVPEFVAHLKSTDWTDTLSFAGRGSTLSLWVRGYGDHQKLVLTQDVTERLRSETMRRDFVANVSHEIRTPLTVLAGFLETMESLSLTQPERHRVQTLMRQQTDRMQMLIDDLLTLAKLEGSPRPPTDSWHSADGVIQRGLADARALSMGRHEIAIVGEPSAVLAGVESELLSAIGNLLTNAVRYTPEGGRIELIWQLRADGLGEITVTDNGIGIAQEHLSRITERFYRVDASRARATGGTGLGLAIVKHVMQRHGGSLDIQSEFGKGSRFRLQFPPGRVRPVEIAAMARRDADTPA